MSISIQVPVLKNWDSHLIPLSVIQMLNKM